MTAKTRDMSGTVVLGRYRVVQPLARGGMGIVYLARTEGAAGFARPVVIKRIVPDLAADEAAAQAFVREARILSNLQHPSIVNVIDFDEEEEAYVMVLEYVHGYNLGQWHRFVVDTRGKFPFDYAVHVVARVLDALHYAHTFIRQDGTPMQIVHRDVSPGNVLIDTQGNVKLLDFGIARANEGGEYRTRDGMFKGKLAFAAPEVYEGVAATPKSDIYSAAVMLYQLLAGENPFRGKDMAEIVKRVLTDKVAPIAAVRDDVPDELGAALETAMARKPENRFPTAAAFAEAIRASRTRREADVVTDFVDEVWTDFNGDMASKLGLEPLQARDAAWRAAVEDPSGRASLSSTPPPEIDATTLQPDATESTAVAGTAAARSPAMARRRAWVLGSAATVVVLAGVAWSLTRSEKPGPERSRFVLVEKATGDVPATPSPSVPEAPRAVEAPAAAATSPAPSAVPAVAIAQAKPTAAQGPADAVALSRVFQRQRGRIESCFASHVKEVDGRPEVSIRFRVGSSGRVESADLAPAALGGTPLGQCLVTVARGTEFGPLTEAVSFTIPITARRVK